MTATVMKMKFEKLKPRKEHLVTTKLNFFPMIKFREYLPSNLPMENISPSDQGFPHKVCWWRGHFDQNHKKLHENCKISFF